MTKKAYVHLFSRDKGEIVQAFVISRDGKKSHPYNWNTALSFGGDWSKSVTNIRCTGNYGSSSRNTVSRLHQYYDDDPKCALFKPMGVMPLEIFT